MASNSVSTTKCYDCGRKISRRDAITLDVHVEHEDRPGYDRVPVPLCRGCVFDRRGVQCDECGEKFLDLDRYNEHYAHRHMDDRGPARPDGGLVEDPRIRVRCEDCDLDRLWPRPADAELHPHDRNTDHTVGYEAAHEEARAETEVDNR